VLVVVLLYSTSTPVLTSIVALVLVLVPAAVLGNRLIHYLTTLDKEASPVPPTPTLPSREAKSTAKKDLPSAQARTTCDGELSRACREGLPPNVQTVFRFDLSETEDDAAPQPLCFCRDERGANAPIMRMRPMLTGTFEHRPV
jgi:hypothetical protein